MAIGRVARKLYSQQGEYGSVRKAYKEAFRRQMIANYAPANIIGRMFGFGSIFHTMAKRTFGTPEWNPRSLETGRPDADARMNFRRGSAGSGGMAGGGIVSRLAERSLAKIEDNTDRTADAMEKLAKIAISEEKRKDLLENFKRELEFEENLRKLKPLPAEKMTIGGPSSKSGESGSLGFGFPGLPKGLFNLKNLRMAGRAAGWVGLVLAGISGFSAAIEEFRKSGDFKEAWAAYLSEVTLGLFGDKAWWKENFVDPLAGVVKNSVVTVQDLWQEFLNSGFLRNFLEILKRPFQSTKQDPVQRDPVPEGYQESELIDGEPVIKLKLKKLDKFEISSFEDMKKKKLTLFDDKTPSGSKNEPGLSVSSQEIPPEAVPLLNAIAEKESGGDYRRIVGDGKYGGPARLEDFSKHPEVFGVGLTKSVGGEWVNVNDPRAVTGSTAAGKYQITQTTWNALRKRYPDLTDFSPENQDKAAWYLAQEKYRAETGEDLLTSLKNRTFKPSALAGTWTSLPGGSEQTWKSEAEFVLYMIANKMKFKSSGSETATPQSSAPNLDVPGATAATKAAREAATSAAETTQIEAAMSTPESVGKTIVEKIPTAAPGASPQMSESVDEFVTRVLVAMGVVTQT